MDTRCLKKPAFSKRILVIAIGTSVLVTGLIRSSIASGISYQISLFVKYMWKYNTSPQTKIKAAAMVYVLSLFYFSWVFYRQLINIAMVYFLFKLHQNDRNLRIPNCYCMLLKFNLNFNEVISFNIQPCSKHFDLIISK